MRVPAGSGSSIAMSRYNAIPAVASWMNPVRPDSRAPRAVVSVPSITAVVPSPWARASRIGTIKGVGTGVGVGSTVGLGVGSGVGVGVGSGVGASVGSAVGVIVSVGAGLGVTWAVGTGVSEGAAVGVGAGVSVGLGVGATVGLALGLGAGTGGEASDCGFGLTSAKKSIEVLFRSSVVPAGRPGLP